MRIALVITELHPGGAERCFVNLAIYLTKQGHHVQIWELWPPPPADKNVLTEQLNAHGIIWKSGGAVKPWHFPSVTRWLRSELAAFQPDVVQSFLFHANFAAALATIKLNTLLFGGARVRQPERWRQRIQRWSTKRMCKLVCVSQGVYDHCQQAERIAPTKLVVIPNGIDRAMLDNRTATNCCWTTLGLPISARVLLFVGRLDRQKGVDLLLRHADTLLAALPQHHLVLMGEGALREELQSLRQKSLERDRIHLPGWQAQAIDWMRMSEVVLLPARYEGMPNVVLEAMAVGKPVVAFNVEGVSELLGENSGTKLQSIAPENIDAFISSVQQLAENRTLAASIGRENHIRAVQAFDLDLQLAKYEVLYRQFTSDQKRATTS